MCDPSCDNESFELFKDKYLLTKKAMQWFWENLNTTIKMSQ